MVDQHHLSSGGLPNAPNNEPSNLWIRRTPNGPHVAPLNQAKRGASPPSNDCKPNVRPKNVAPIPAQEPPLTRTNWMNQASQVAPDPLPTPQPNWIPQGQRPNGPAASPC
ncbi:hypothetical protein PGT21_019455 [Puccinia graminis f. sp. tritici]|uniref:Uncharacterized protein n=2 Tax=Puccinia graminis f. sp. tritici TaxID=56615 RepID=E3K4Q2_PUCGT|nr:uncharacterized protein PGTG_05539 [Puccinia graminis f. sp. tritici CRL 75-36-700-3]EFP79218.2 hypothetical protein PGTG_05539 [Puccinia graminis f. sp. tritici CRL 75-36-700-3]KAA1086999.1 hypothetical protein PGT21_019455 [Puccinia graminis f. sp. tritici]